MIDESLNTYRQERKAFILGLKHYYGIDFYDIEKQERTEWLRAYIESKREFFEQMIEHWESCPPQLISSFPDGYFSVSKEKMVNRRIYSFELELPRHVRTSRY